MDVLGGAPGIFSARWAGRHGDDRANYELLLACRWLTCVPEHRGAGFVCAVRARPARWAVLVEEGQFRGSLRGLLEGPTALGTTRSSSWPTAALRPSWSPAGKNARSHRGNAFRALAERFSGRVRDMSHEPSRSTGYAGDGVAAGLGGFGIATFAATGLSPWARWRRTDTDYRTWIGDGRPHAAVAQEPRRSGSSAPTTRLPSGSPWRPSSWRYSPGIGSLARTRHTPALLTLGALSDW